MGWHPLKKTVIILCLPYFYLQYNEIPCCVCEVAGHLMCTRKAKLWTAYLYLTIFVIHFVLRIFIFAIMFMIFLEQNIYKILLELSFCHKFIP